MTGYFLILVAAGVLSYGVHELQEAGFFTGEDSFAFDVSATISSDSFFGTLARGIFNFRPATTWLEAIAWVSYVAFAVWLFNHKKPAVKKIDVPLTVKK